MTNEDRSRAAVKISDARDRGSDLHDAGREAMYQSLLRMVSGDSYELPEPLFPLYEGIDTVREVMVLYGIDERLVRWVDAATEILCASPPPADEDVGRAWSDE